MSRSSALMNSGSSSGPAGGSEPCAPGGQGCRPSGSSHRSRPAGWRRIAACSPRPSRGGRRGRGGKCTARQQPHAHAADQQPRDEQGGQYSQQHHGRSLTSVVPARR